MIRLGEVVSGLVNEMAMARTKAALFGVEMATDFRDHEILRHLPVPSYRIGAVEVTLQFVVADLPDPPQQPPRPRLSRADLTELVRQVTESLVERRQLRNAFAPFGEQAETRSREIAEHLVREMEAEGVEELSPEAISRVYGQLVKSRFLVTLLEPKARVSRAKIQATIEADHPGRVGELASRLLKEKLDEAWRRSEVEKERSPTDREPGMYVLVEANDLAEHVGRISTLKVELEEESLERTILHGREED